MNHTKSYKRMLKHTIASIAALAQPGVSGKPVIVDPKSWSRSRKMSIAALLSLTQLVTLIGASMPAPALPEISRDLHLSRFGGQIIFSIYFLGLGLAPLCIAVLSEICGRKIVWIGGNAWFVLWNTLCPVGSQRNTRVSFMVIGRLMSGAGGSVGVTLSGPIMADIYSPEQRGWSLAISQFAPYFGPALGPVLGGIASEHIGWPWLFWILSILDGVLLIVGLYVLRESYQPVIQQKADVRLQKMLPVAAIANDDHPHMESAIAMTSREEQIPKGTRLRKCISRPISLLFKRPIIPIIALILLVNFGIYTLTLSTFASMWIRQYKMSTISSSLNYIAIALGSICGTQIGGRLLDLTYKRLKARHPEGMTQPEFRIPPLVPGSVLMPTGLLLYGWAVHSNLPWIAVDIGVFIFTFGSFGVAQALMAYILDEFTEFAASAGAATRLMSYTAGFAFPIFAPQLYQSIGYGWANTLLALLFTLISWPLSFVLWNFGPKIRAIGKEA